jgi:hypothetical protein
VYVSKCDSNLTSSYHLDFEILGNLKLWKIVKIKAKINALKAIDN